MDQITWLWLGFVGGAMFMGITITVVILVMHWNTTDKIREINKKKGDR